MRDTTLISNNYLQTLIQAASALIAGEKDNSGGSCRYRFPCFHSIREKHNSSVPWYNALSHAFFSLLACQNIHQMEQVKIQH